MGYLSRTEIEILITTNCYLLHFLFVIRFLAQSSLLQAYYPKQVKAKCAISSCNILSKTFRNELLMGLLNRITPFASNSSWYTLLGNVFKRKKTFLMIHSNTKLHVMTLNKMPSLIFIKYSHISMNQVLNET